MVLAKNDQIFKSVFFHLFMSLGISACRETPLGIIFNCKYRPDKGNSCLTLTVTLSFVGYFFVPSPLGGLKSVSWDIFRHTDSIGSF